MRNPTPVLLGLALAACTADEPPVSKATKAVAWSIIGATVRPAGNGGDSLLVTVTLKANIEKGWHVYSLTQKAGGPTRMTVTIEPSPPYMLGASVSGPQPTLAMDPNFGVESATYSGEPRFDIPVMIASDSLAGSPTLEIAVRSQACSDRVCLPAKTTRLSTRVLRQDA